MKATPFLMFQGEASSALALYREAFPDFEELLLQEHAEGPQAGQVARVKILSYSTRTCGCRFSGSFDPSPFFSLATTPS